MKKSILNKLPVILIITILFSACSSVRVSSDYDKGADFNSYKTFAFFKTGIDKAEINDIEKRRILRAIESEMITKGFTKSKTPDLLVSIFTKSREQVNVFNNNFGGFGYGWNWSPWYWNNFNNTSMSTNTQGILYIDLIDAKKKELVWQGTGTGYLTTSEKVDKKEARVKTFVSKILAKYPALN